VAVAAGDAIGHGRAGLAIPAVVTGVLALAGVLLARDRRAVAVVAALVAIAAATAASAGWRAGSKPLLPRLAERAAVVSVCGIVSEPGRNSVVASARTVELDHKRWHVDEDLRVSGEGAKSLRPGERFCAIGTMHAARPGRADPPLLHADRLEKKGIASPLRFAAGSVRRA